MSFELKKADRDVLRSLAEQVAEIAALPVHAAKAELWRRVNQLEPARPVVWINEIPWSELAEEPELHPACRDGWARRVETGLRRRLYQWRHFPADMVVSDYYACPVAWSHDGFGFEQRGRWLRPRPGAVASQQFEPQIRRPGDVNKIRPPTVARDDEATEARLAFCREAFGDVLNVRPTGVRHIWFTPWDNLIRWWGVEQALMDLVLRPDMVNEAVSRFVDASLKMLDRMIELNLLDEGHTNLRVGSGGYAYTDELPGAAFDPARVLPGNMWGCSNAQIFSDVSPEMHWQFALRHDLPWLERWGLTYYGCCEPLHQKVDILRRIPNLRKISMSPWIDLERAAENVGTDYVFSYKPSPAVLATDTWDVGRAREQLRAGLEATRGLHVEIIMKDISTLRGEPRRLEEWARMAVELAEQFGG